MVTLRRHNLVAFWYSNESTLRARSTGLRRTTAGTTRKKMTAPVYTTAAPPARSTAPSASISLAFLKRSFSSAVLRNTCVNCETRKSVKRAALLILADKKLVTLTGPLRLDFFLSSLTTTIVLRNRSLGL
jgi:hypothetical protein